MRQRQRAAWQIPPRQRRERPPGAQRLRHPLSQRRPSVRRLPPQRIFPQTAFLEIDARSARRIQVPPHVPIPPRVSPMRRPRDPRIRRRPKILDVHPPIQRPVNHIHRPVPIHIRDRRNVFQPARNRQNQLLRPIQRKNMQVPVRRIRPRIIRPNDNFFLAISINVARHRRRRQARRKIFRPPGPVHQFDSIPCPERDGRGLRERQHIHLVVMVRVHRNHARAVEPPMRRWMGNRRQPFPPKDRPIVVQHRLRRLPIRVDLRARHQRLLPSIPIHIRHVDIDSGQIRTAQQPLVFAKHPVQHPLPMEPMRLRSVERRHTVRVVQRIDFPRHPAVRLPHRQSRLHQLVEMVRQRRGSRPCVQPQHPARPRLPHLSPFPAAPKVIDERVVILRPQQRVRLDFPRCEDLQSPIPSQVREDRRRNFRIKLRRHRQRRLPQPQRRHVKTICDRHEPRVWHVVQCRDGPRPQDCSIPPQSHHAGPRREKYLRPPVAINVMKRG